MNRTWSFGSSSSPSARLPLTSSPHAAGLSHTTALSPFQSQLIQLFHNIDSQLKQLQPSEADPHTLDEQLAIVYWKLKKCEWVMEEVGNAAGGSSGCGGGEAEQFNWAYFRTRFFHLKEQFEMKKKMAHAQSGKHANLAPETPVRLHLGVTPPSAAAAAAAADAFTASSSSSSSGVTVTIAPNTAAAATTAADTSPPPPPSVPSSLDTPHELPNIFVYGTEELEWSPSSQQQDALSLPLKHAEREASSSLALPRHAGAELPDPLSHASAPPLSIASPATQARLSPDGALPCGVGGGEQQRAHAPQFAAQYGLTISSASPSSPGEGGPAHSSASPMLHQAAGGGGLLDSWSSGGRFSLVPISPPQLAVPSNHSSFHDRLSSSTSPPAEGRRGSGSKASRQRQARDDEDNEEPGARRGICTTVKKKWKWLSLLAFLSALFIAFAILWTRPGHSIFGRFIKSSDAAEEAQQNQPLVISPPFNSSSSTAAAWWYGGSSTGTYVAGKLSSSSTAAGPMASSSAAQYAIAPSSTGGDDAAIPPIILPTGGTASFVDPLSAADTAMDMVFSSTGMVHIASFDAFSRCGVSSVYFIVPPSPAAAADSNQSSNYSVAPAAAATVVVWYAATNENNVTLYTLPSFTPDQLSTMVLQVSLSSIATPALQNISMVAYNRTVALHVATSNPLLYTSSPGDLALLPSTLGQPIDQMDLFVDIGDCAPPLHTTLHIDQTAMVVVESSSGMHVDEAAGGSGGSATATHVSSTAAAMNDTAAASWSSTAAAADLPDSTTAAAQSLTGSATGIHLPINSSSTSTATLSPDTTYAINTTASNSTAVFPFLFSSTAFYANSTTGDSQYFVHDSTSTAASGITASIQ